MDAEAAMAQQSRQDHFHFVKSERCAQTTMRPAAKWHEFKR
jgi:hypothetical protein